MTRASLLLSATVAALTFFWTFDASAGGPADRYTDHSGPNRYTNSYTKHYFDGHRGHLNGYVRAGRTPNVDIRNDSLGDNTEMPGLNERMNDRDNKSTVFRNYRQNRQFYHTGYGTNTYNANTPTHGIIVTEPNYNTDTGRTTRGVMVTDPNYNTTGVGRTTRGVVVTEPNYNTTGVGRTTRGVVVTEPNYNTTGVGRTTRGVVVTQPNNY